MGLDIVELVLTVEEEFDISLPDTDMEDIRTPRDLATYIYKRYQEYDKTKCSSQVGFYKIRRIMMEEFGFKRHQLYPDTKLQELFGKDIRNKWKKLNSILDSKLNYPSLRFTDIGANIVLILSLVFSIGFFYFYTKYSIEGILKVILVFIFSYVILYYMLSPFFATIVPKQYQKLSSLIKFTGESSKIDKYKSFNDILEKVIEIRITQLNLSPDEISPDSRYVEDLGAG